MCYWEPDVPSYQLWGSMRKFKPHRGNFIDSVSQLGLVGLAPCECGEAGEQLEDLAAWWRGCPWWLQLGVPS